MSNLRAEVAEAADQFVAAVIEAIRFAPLSEVAGLSEEPARAPVRPSAARAPARRPGRPAKATVPARAAAKPAPVSAKRGPTGRRQRASAEEIEQLKQSALDVAKELPAGFSKGDVMKRSGSNVDLGRALGLLVADGVLIKKGDRRNTRYWVK